MLGNWFVELFVFLGILLGFFDGGVGDVIGDSCDFDFFDI